jgi:hypothetical protein
MSPGWELTLGIVGGAASIAVILDYFGIKPSALAWQSIMALSQKWKLVIMLGLVCLTLSFSGYGFYRSLRPHVIEKIVEKPVDRVVEKERIVQAECPKTDTKGTAKSKANKDSPPVTPPQQLPIKQDCGGGNCAASVGQQGGITAGALTITPLPRELSPEQKSAIKTAIEGKTCKITMLGALSNVEDAAAYAIQLRDAFRAGGCSVPDNVLPLINSEGGWYGLKVVYHNDTLIVPGERVYTAPDTPAGVVLKALDSAHLGNVFIGGDSSTPQDMIEVAVGRQPK